MSRCVYCGENPVPHLPTRFFETLLSFTGPFERVLLVSWIRNPTEFVLDKLFIALLRSFEFVKLARFRSDRTLLTVARARVFWEEAERRGVPMEQLVLFGKEVDFYRVTLFGKRVYFTSLPRPRGANKDALLWLDDKAILKEVFLKSGIPVAKGGSVKTFRGAKKLFQTLQTPVIVKPRLGSRGRHTTTHIYTEEQLVEAVRIAQKLCQSVIVEEQLFGNVYRGTVVGGKLAGVLGGSPPQVTGDGEKTIRELAVIKNEARDKRVAEVKVTPELERFLARQNFLLDSIVPIGVKVDLSEKIGAAYGGTSFEILSDVHPKLQAHLEAAAKVVNDPLLGFDFIIEDPKKDPDGQRWGILECNGMPFIHLHHEPLIGAPSNVAGALWDVVLKSYVKETGNMK